jgi:hypothetical protein
MANARILEFLLSGVFDSSGNPLSGGKVYTYAVGGTTDKPVYTDAAKTHAASNPVILDGSGRAIVYADGNYKFLIKDKNGATIFTVDNFDNQLTLVAHDTTHETDGGDEVTPIVHHARHELGGADAINFPTPLHASTHQEGGDDEVVPALHAARHEEGGADQVTPTLHHTRHEKDGPDEITGLYYLLIGFLDDPVVLLSTAELYDWTDFDISAHTEGHAAKAAILQVYTTIGSPSYSGSELRYAAADCYLRPKGSSLTLTAIRQFVRTADYAVDPYNIPLSAHGISQLIVPVNGDQIFQARLADEGTWPIYTVVHYIYLLGYFR